MILYSTDSCPFCNGKLQSRGTIKRIIRTENGKKKKITVHRYSCTKCKKWFRILPKNILTYKQYP